MIESKKFAYAEMNVRSIRLKCVCYEAIMRVCALGVYISGNSTLVLKKIQMKFR